MEVDTTYTYFRVPHSGKTLSSIVDGVYHLCHARRKGLVFQNENEKRWTERGERDDIHDIYRSWIYLISYMERRYVRDSGLAVPNREMEGDLRGCTSKGTLQGDS